MNKTRNPQWARFVPLIIMLVISVGLSFWMRDFVRDVIVRPMLMLGWLATMMYNSLSDALLWGLFLFIGGIIALRSLLGGRRYQRLHRDEGPVAGGAVSDWSRQVQRASESGYAQWRLAQSLGKLSWRLLQDERSKKMRDIEVGLRAQKLVLPPEIQAYFEAGMSSYRPMSNMK